MIKRSVIATITVLAVTLSGCASTSALPAPRTAVAVTVPAAAAPTTLERKPVVLPPRTAAPLPTRKPTPTRSPRTTSAPKPPPLNMPVVWKPPARTWAPSASNGPDTIMRNAALDAGEWWSAGLSGVPRIDARSGGTGCGVRDKPTAAISCGDGRIRWDTDRMLLVVAKAPYRESRPWVLAIASAHEVAHAVTQSLLRRSNFTDRQWESLADCMAGAYISLRYRDVLDPRVEAGAYNAIWQLRKGSYAHPDAYGAGLRVPVPPSPRIALEHCRLTALTA